MSGINLQQGFPNIRAPMVDPETGIINQTWLQLLISLWNRTGQGPGTLPDDGSGIGVAALGLGNLGGLLDQLTSVETLAISRSDTIHAASDGLDVAGFALQAPIPTPEQDTSFLMATMLVGGVGGSNSGGGPVTTISGSTYVSVNSSAGAYTVSAIVGTSGPALAATDGANIWSAGQTLQAGATIGGAITDVTDGLNVSGAALTATNGALFNAMDVTGPSTLTGGILGSSGITVNGGVADFTDGLNVSGNALTAVNGCLVNTLDCTGVATISGTLLASNGITVNGSVAIYTAGMSVSGGLNVSGGFSAVGGSLFDNINVTGNSTVSGNLGGINALGTTSFDLINDLALSSDNHSNCAFAGTAWANVESYAFTNASDPRLKDPVGEFPEAIPMVRKLADAVMQFTWKSPHPDDDAKFHWSFDASRLEAICGEGFGGHIVGPNGVHRMRPMELLPLLARAIAELDARSAPTWP